MVVVADVAPKEIFGTTKNTNVKMYSETFEIKDMIDHILRQIYDLHSFDYRSEPLIFLHPKRNTRYASPTPITAVRITSTDAPKSVSVDVTRACVAVAVILKNNYFYNATPTLALLLDDTTYHQKLQTLNLKRNQLKNLKELIEQKDVLFLFQSYYLSQPPPIS